MLEGLFGTVQACLPSEYQGSRPRKLIVECSSLPRSGKFQEFFVTLVGHPYKDFRFQKTDLDAYISGRQLLLNPCGVVLMDNRNTAAIDYVEAGLLNILQTTGYGDVTLILQKDYFICRVAYSYRQVLT